MSGEREAVFLDRDGTLIVDTGYVRDPDRVELLPDVAVSLARLRSAGFALVLVSNQSGIGRGLITPEQASAVDRHFAELLSREGIALDGSFYCPHAPDEGCSCRKPRPGMLLKAAETLDLDLGRSFLVGDKASDVEAGRRAGCRTVLLNSPYDVSADPDLVAESWPEAVDLMLSEARG